MNFYCRFNENAQSLLKKLLEKNPNNRPDFKQIKNHKFFAGIDWDLLTKKELRPPIRPY